MKINITLSLEKIREVLPDFNLKVQDERLFWRICKRLKVIVREMPLEVDGYYQFYRGRHYILINSKLRSNPRKWLHTAWHEFCHVLFDVPQPNQALFRRPCGDYDDPCERFADAFGLMCILPWTEVERLRWEDLSNDPDLGRAFSARVIAHKDFGQ